MLESPSDADDGEFSQHGVQESTYSPQQMMAGMKDVLEGHPFLSMQPHEQVQKYRVSSLLQGFSSTCRNISSQGPLSRCLPLTAAVNSKGKEVATCRASGIIDLPSHERALRWASL